MAHGWHYFEGFGRCIYCLQRGGELTKEHVVPLGLGGQQVIRNAGCKKCAKITSIIERKVQKDLWGDARVAYNFPSRRKNKRPKKIKINSNLTTPIEEYPAAFPIYHLPNCGAFLGLPDTVDLTGQWLPHTAINDNDKLEKFEKKYGIAPTVKFRNVPNEFGRMIAKISYCITLTLLGLDAFESICLPYILDSSTNNSFIVGGKKISVTTPDKTMYKLGTVFKGNRNLLSVIGTVRLFCDQFDDECPEYHVFVGVIEGHHKISEVLNKLDLDAVGIHHQNSIIETSYSNHYFQKWPPVGVQ